MCNLLVSYRFSKRQCQVKYKFTDSDSSIFFFFFKRVCKLKSDVFNKQKTIYLDIYSIFLYFTIFFTLFSVKEKNTNVQETFNYTVEICRNYFFK